MAYLERGYNYLGSDGCSRYVKQPIQDILVQNTERLINQMTEKARMETMVIEPFVMRFNADKRSVDFIKAINPDDITGVYFNDKKMTTVVKWKDGTITKVKAQLDKGDAYNPETGMAMCICKKALGNKGNFNEVFKKWLPEEHK